MQAPVSVIIPCFECDPTVSRAVTSVLSQTLLPTEIWLVDDASGDGGRTLETLRRIQAENQSAVRIEVIASTVNLGPGEARNLAWERVTQPYIALLDADDAWHRQKIEIQYKWMSEHPEVAICGHRDRLGNGRQQLFELDQLPVQEVTRAQLLTSNRILTRTAMLRTALPFRFPTNRRYSDDYYLWLQAVLGGQRAAIIDLPLACHFRPLFSGGVSNALWQMERGELENYTRLFHSGLVRTWELPLLYSLSLAKFARRLLITAFRQARRGIAEQGE